MRGPAVFLTFAVVAMTSVAPSLVASATAGRVKPLLPIDKLRKQFYRLEDELQAILAGNEHEENNEVSKKTVLVNVLLIRKLQEFDAELNQEFPNDITYGLDILQNSWLWARATGELRTIFALYEAFRRFQSQQTGPGRIPSPSQAWIDFAQTVLFDPKASMPKSLQQLHNLVASENLFLNCLREIDGSTMCNMKESPQQMLLNLYNTVASTELKAYTMIQFSYMLLKHYGMGNFTGEAEEMKSRFQERTVATLESMMNALPRTSRSFWMCDPRTFVKDKNYYEITELLQGYVQNEVDLNPEGTCRENCAEYRYTKSHSCYMNLFCKQQRRCNGKIINCQFIDSDAFVCPAEPGSNRRYEYIEYENGRILGRKTACHRGTTKVDSWWRWLFWHCSYCICLCDEQGSNSDRYINMRPSVTNIEDNWVATGMVFTKVDRVIYLQMQEGKLEKTGRIEVNSTRWVPVDSYSITDFRVRNEVDYHTLTFEKRALDLDDIEADNNDELLTGVQFKLLGSHLNVEFRFTPFDYLSGKLSPEKSYWKSNINTDAARINPSAYGVFRPIRLRKLNLEDRDIPTRAQSLSQPDSVSDQYLEFTHTGLDRDVAQTTIPFIDAQPVENLIPVPLSGAGIYHKGLTYFGGFIAPKIFTYNYHDLLTNAVNDLELNQNALVN